MTTSTMNNDIVARRIVNFGRAVLVALFAIMLIATMHPDVRSAMRGSFVKDQRMVVSTVHADLIGDGTRFQIAKIKTQDALLLEIYENLPNGGTRLIERTVMTDKRDGFFTFNGQATNLAVEDINGDGRPEILAPSFDNNLVGHVNIYSYDKDAKSLTRILQ